MLPKLGILAGGGELPARLIDVCRRTERQFFVIAFKGQADAGAIADAPHAWVRLGAAGSTLKLLREAGVEELVMAGGITRPSLVSLRPDAVATRILARGAVMSLGDDGLLSVLVKALEEEGFRVVGLDDLMPDTIAEAGVYGAVAPDDGARQDIARGIAVGHAIGGLDIGQAVVVQQGLVLAVEAVEGTDAMLARCAELRREGARGVLVKVKKPAQERRADLPTIGEATVRAAAAAGLAGIAVEAGGALVVDRSAVVESADAAGLFVVGIDVTE